MEKKASIEGHGHGFEVVKAEEVGDKDHGIGDNVVGNKEEGLSKGNVMVGHRDNFTSKSALGVDINGK